MARGLVFILALFFAFTFDLPFQQPCVAEREVAGKVLKDTSKVQELNTGKNTYYTDKFAVLTYHHIDAKESTYTISPERFIEQLDTLKSLGYNFISLSQATDFLEGKEKLPVNAIVVTFDDGYDSFYRYAYPILRQRSIPATMFVVVGYVGGSKAGTRRLGWREMKEMQKDSFTFQSHTYNSHDYIMVDADGTMIPSLAGLAYQPDHGRETRDKFKLRVGKDLHKAKELLETNLGQRVEYLALPFGITNNETISIAQGLGYKYILTTSPGLNSPDTRTTILSRFNAGSPRKSGKSIHREIMAQGLHLEPPSQASESASDSGSRAYYHTAQTIVDPTALKIISTSPSETGIVVGKTISVYFTNEIAMGIAFNEVILKDASGNSVATKKSIVGDELKIDPVNYLSYDTTYTVIIPATAVKSRRTGRYPEREYTFSFATRATDPSFKDVTSNNWAYNHIINLANATIIKGYNDGSFRPAEKVTRAEFVVMLGNAIGYQLPKKVTTPSFSDIDRNTWAWQYIETAKANGIIDGYSDDTFRPDNFITRAEIAKITTEALKLSSGDSSLPDTGTSWAKDCISACATAGIIDGYPDNTFRPSSNATRAEAAKIIVALLNNK